ncbi:MAG TPA: hypothetical protein VGM53_35525 [Streptosporangiaceae bacterium]|jgi:hypothetical protein
MPRAQAGCQAGKPRPPGRAAIALAVPGGSRRPPRTPGFQPAYLAALAKDPRLAALRGDFRHNVMELARIYAEHACWADMTTWRPREDILAEIGSPRDRSRPLSVTAYRAARRWLQEHGYLGLVCPGWTSSLRAGALDDADQLCPVYVLAIPRVPKTRHIPPPRLESPPVNRALTTPACGVVKAPAHARGQTWGQPGHDHDGPRSARTDPQPANPAGGTKTQKRTESQAAAAVILTQSGPLRPLTAEHVAAVIRPWTAAGWTPGDVLWALRHLPPDHAGRCRPYGYTAGIRHPAAWLAWRLARWASPDGTPLAAPSRRDAAERARVLADQAARRAERTRPDGGAAQFARRAERQARGQAPTLRDILTGASSPAPAGELAAGQPARPAHRAGSLPGPAALPAEATAPATAAAYWRAALLAHLPDAGALARAQSHRASTAAGLGGPASAAAIRAQTAPLIARADAAASQHSPEPAPSSPSSPSSQPASASPDNRERADS